MGGESNPYVGPYIVIWGEFNWYDVADEIGMDMDFVFGPEYLEIGEPEEHQVFLYNGGGMHVGLDVMYDESVVRHSMANLMQKFRNEKDFKTLEEYLINNNITYKVGFGFCNYWN